MSLLTPRAHYKPFDYPWAFDYYLVQNQIHWLPEEVPLGEDVKDWNFKLTPEAKHLLTQLFRFFTQADVDVSDCYMSKYMRVFGANPEIRMMLGAFNNMESVHAHAYSLLLDTVGMPETEYQAFLQYKEMADKHDFIGNFSVEDPYETAKAMAVISGGIEGIQLFSSFAMLLNFPRQGLMRGMGQIITWSVRDESLHVEGLSKLFKTFVKENRSVWTDKLKKDIYASFEQIVEQEFRFIDLAFELGGVEGMEPWQVKDYVKYIADRRLIGLGMKGIFKVKKNPLVWLDDILNAVEHTNFFENRATEYSKGATLGSWNDVWEDHDALLIPKPVEGVYIPASEPTQIYLGRQ